MAELGDGNVGAGRLVKPGADALEKALAGIVAGAGEAGNVLRVKADLGHLGADWGDWDGRIYNG